MPLTNLYILYLCPHYLIVKPAENSRRIIFLLPVQQEWRRRAGSNRRIAVLQTAPLATWVRRHGGHYILSEGREARANRQIGATVYSAGRESLESSKAYDRARRTTAATGHCCRLHDAQPAPRRLRLLSLSPSDRPLRSSTP